MRLRTAVLRAAVLACLALASGAVLADGTLPSHHVAHAHHSKSTKHKVARVRPGAKPDVAADLDLAAGAVRRGCAASGLQADELLEAIGVHDPDVATEYRRVVVPGAEVVPACIPYAVTTTRDGRVRALGLHVPPAGAGDDRLVMLWRAAPGAVVESRIEDLDATMRDVTTLTMPLRDVAARSAEIQSAVPAEVLYSLTSLASLLHAPAADDSDDGYLVRAAFVTGAGADAGRLLSVEVVERGTQDVVREALWIERDGLPGGYFAPDGTSFEHALWTAPVSFTRISRGIGNFRTTVRHPVTKRSGHKTRVVMARSTRRGTHVGVDFAAPAGTPVISVADGRVVEVGPRGGYGNLIVIEHAGGYTTRYAHLSGFAPDIEVGSEVRRGSEIGYVGSTGFSTGPHLHFEIRRDGVYFDPLDERLAFGLWSMRPVDYLPMMRQALIADATDRLAREGAGTVLTTPVAGAGAAPSPADGLRVGLR